jgi:hypothetical protein|tara:strand:+ start:989 stop:1216 length:228 start_codon:yes stop_codon:yes gene_type:complete
MDEVNWNALQWEGSNELWEEVLKHLANFQAAETDVALSPDLSSEQRHYLSGKAVALAEFKDHLKHLREMAIQNKK